MNFQKLEGEFYNVHVPLDNEDISENVRRQLNLTRPKKVEKDKLQINAALDNLISKSGPKVGIDDFQFLMVLGKGVSVRSIFWIDWN